MQAALADALVVICLLPLTPDTRGILNSALFAQLPEGAGLVLCSRGEHLVRNDLVEALRCGQLRGAVLDVFEREPLAAEDPLWEEPGVLITPHMSALAKPRRIAEQIADNVYRLREGRQLCNLIDRSQGY
jgi:glyoxylate/hydroxypyruvate reductase A